MGEGEAVLCRDWNIHKLFCAVYDCVVPDALGFAPGGLIRAVVEMAAERFERRHRGLYELDVFIVLRV